MYYFSTLRFVLQKWIQIYKTNQFKIQIDWRHVLVEVLLQDLECVTYSDGVRKLILQLNREKWLKFQLHWRQWYCLNWIGVNSLAAKIVIVVHLQAWTINTHVAASSGRSASQLVDAVEQGHLDPWPNGYYALESAFVVRITFFSLSSAAHLSFWGFT